MILLTHPFGNANVRAVLDALERNDLLTKFVTAIGWSTKSHRGLDGQARSLFRRNFDVPPRKIEVHPARELVRLLAGRFGLHRLIEHEAGWASIDKVWQNLDRIVAHRLCHAKYRNLRCVYAYEDCAEQIFLAASALGFRRVYDLPIAYWEIARALLREEARRYPDWEPTLGATRDSDEKLARKTRELDLAELVICPSAFVLDSLPSQIRREKQCLVVPFGTPPFKINDNPMTRESERPLRVLYAGALSQRKGLADIFAAMKLIKSKQIELVVMGSLIKPLNWYRQRLPSFTYESPRPHEQVLNLMQTCDVFLLPSLVEGRALVQQEAMACGLPVIATSNAGAEDLIHDGETGFLVPIRNPETIAAKLDWCAENRSAVAGMGIAAQRRASEFTWRGYGDTIVAAIRELISE